MGVRAAISGVLERNQLRSNDAAFAQIGTKIGTDASSLREWVRAHAPATACHLEVQVPADQIAAPLPVSVVVSPGGWTQASAPATLSVR